METFMRKFLLGLCKKTKQKNKIFSFQLLKTENFSEKFLMEMKTFHFLQNLVENKIHF